MLVARDAWKTKRGVVVLMKVSGMPKESERKGDRR
jgi:hypothetical protein